MPQKSLKNLVLGLAAASALTASACSPSLSSMEMRDVTADRIARPAFMAERVVPAGMFDLMAWERIHEDYAPVTLYIEGDGLAWVSPQRVSLDPTPKNPVGLHIAAMDKSENVVWLARPCQYIRSEACDAKYWTGARFAPGVIESYMAALDNIKRMYGVPEFHLVGYSGGAAVAALLAAERDDVASFRSVAGNLDHETWTNLHGVSALEQSLNPVDVARDIAHIPQHHFIGGQDEIVPPALYHSWAQASGETDCVRSTLVIEAEHEDGWPAQWPDLLDRELDCEGPPKPPPAPIPQDFIDAGKGKL